MALASDRLDRKPKKAMILPSQPWVSESGPGLVGRQVREDRTIRRLGPASAGHIGERGNRDGSVLSEVPNEARDVEPDASDHEERQAGHTWQVPGMWHADVPHRQELSATKLDT